jgi:hypothetical protein
MKLRITLSGMKDRKIMDYLFSNPTVKIKYNYIHNNFIQKQKKNRDIRTLVVLLQQISFQNMVTTYNDCAVMTNKT